MSDVIRSRGVGAFGTRLRRLSERVDRDVREIYRARGIEFEPSWFPIFTALEELGPLSVGEVAARTGVSHAAVSQIRAKLLAEGLIVVKADAADQRRQMLQVSAKGRTLAAKLRPLWAAVAKATAALCAESAPNILQQLDAIEAALERKGLQARVGVADGATKGTGVGRRKNVAA